MIKYSERGLSKFFLIRLNNAQISALAEREGMDTETLKASYLYPAVDDHVGISEAVYDYTQHSKPPDSGKLRRINPA